LVHLEIELQANLTVYIDEIRMGSTLAEDVFHILKDGSEVLLYARGQVINSPIQLQRLRSAGVKTILVDLNIPGLELNSNNHCSDEVIADFGELRSGVKSARRNDQLLRENLNTFFERVQDSKQVMFGDIEGPIKQLLLQNRKNPDLALAMVSLRELMPYVYKHSINISNLMVKFALFQNPDSTANELYDYALCGLIHDIGMLHCFSDKDNLQSREFNKLEEFQMHPEFGREIVKTMSGISANTRMAIGQHHERLSGSGFPYGLKGDEINYLSYVTGICDSYESLVTDQSYRKALSPAVAVKLMQSWGGREFSRELVDSFLASFGQWPVGSPVELNNGIRGVVAMSSGEDDSKPVVCFKEDNKLTLLDLADPAYTISRGVHPKNVDLPLTEIF
jgi:HD-GYP domain-containing protein (c-di-GMP phosphodiesterase class II)